MIKYNQVKRQNKINTKEITISQEASDKKNNCSIYFRYIDNKFFIYTWGATKQSPYWFKNETGFF